MSFMKHLIQGIDTIIIRVANLKKSKEWYVDVLGLEMIFNDPNFGLTVLNTKGATSLTLWQTEDKIERNSKVTSYPIFKTSDAKKARNEMLENGIEVSELEVDEQIKSFQFFDLDGNVLELCEVIQNE